MGGSEWEQEREKMCQTWKKVKKLKSLNIFSREFFDYISMALNYSRKSLLASYLTHPDSHSVDCLFNSGRTVFIFFSYDN